MLPDCWAKGDLFAIPKFEVTRKDVDGFLEELKGFHEEFRDCFSRIEPHESFFRYMVGQLSELERKSIEPIALSGKQTSVRSMQRAVSEVFWDEAKILRRHRSMVNEDMGDPNGVLIFDESGFLKKKINLIYVQRTKARM